jgi:plastocyanin
MIGWNDLVAPALALLVAAGCGGGDGGGDTGGGAEGGAAGGGAAAAAENPVDPATAGSVSGSVTFTGTPAAAEPIDMSAEPICADKHATPPMTEVAVVGSGGGLANVFVYVKSGLGDMQFPAASEAVVLDQEGCVYHPHVLGVMSGQDITIRNSDALLHNIKATPEENRGFNRSQPQAGMEFPTSFAVPEVMIPVQCDVHGWMQAYVGVTSHPFHAVTDESGSFSLQGLPPGDYEIEAWHERYGTATQTVTVPPSGQVQATFAFNDQMAGRHVPLGAPAWVDHETGQLRRGPAGAGQLP